MAKEAVMQVRIDPEIKQMVESLYRSMGTSFAEAIRIFAVQSINEHGYPFTPTAYVNRDESMKGRLSLYSDVTLIEKEGDAFYRAVIEKHEKTY